MSKQTNLTQKLVFTFINANKSFKFKDLEKHVFDNGGIGRMGPNYTLKDYLHNLNIRDHLSYDHLTGIYQHYKVA